MKKPALVNLTINGVAYKGRVLNIQIHHKPFGWLFNRHRRKIVTIRLEVENR